jgi:DNA-3-methyladenine glycosylase
MNSKLDRHFYLRNDTAAIARDLLGKLLVVPTETGERVSGMIVETEAYLGETDRAAHSYGGRRTARNEITYAIGGHVYVFFIYGMYYQLNVVCGQVNSPHVVLIRAIEPVEGIEIMRERRGFSSEPEAVATGSRRDTNLTSGPGKLCIALDIDRRLNGEDLLGEKIWIEKHETVTDTEITVGTRIGIDYAGEDAKLPLRFCLEGNAYVSRGQNRER